MQRNLLLILLIIAAVKIPISVFFEPVRLKVIDGKCHWNIVLPVDKDESLVLSKHIIILSPDSAIATYGELGKNGAIVYTDLDVNDSSLQEEIFAVEGVNGYLPLYHKLKNLRWLFYFILALPFALVVLLNLYFRKETMDDSIVYSNVQPISKYRRFFAFCIDVLIFRVIHKSTMDPLLMNYIYEYSLLSFSLNVSMLWLQIWFDMVIFFAYYFISEYFFGRTIGMWLCKMQVVSEDRHKPTIKAITIRTICRMFGLDKASWFILFLSSPTDGSPRLWHDSISKTRVIFK